MSIRPVRAAQVFTAIVLSAFGYFSTLAIFPYRFEIKSMNSIRTVLIESALGPFGNFRGVLPQGMVLAGRETLGYLFLAFAFLGVMILAMPAFSASEAPEPVSSGENLSRPLPPTARTLSIAALSLLGTILGALYLVSALLQKF